MTHYVFEEDDLGSVVGHNVGRADISIAPISEGVWGVELRNGSELETLYLDINTSPDTTAQAVAAATSSVVKGMVCDLTLDEFAQAVQALLTGL